MCIGLVSEEIRFVFLQDSEQQDGVGRVQNNSEVGLYPKALTACQMFAPNPGLVGCTVLRYLLQHQCFSGSKDSHRGRWSPGGLFTALDQPSSELSSLPGSGDCDVVPSTHVHGLSSLWTQSFGLTSSSVSGGTAADPAALDPRRTASNEQKWDNSPVSLQRHSQSIDNSQDNNLIANERHVQEGDKFCLRPPWRNSVFVTKDLQGCSSERDHYKALQNPLEIGEKDSLGQISIQRSRGLEKSQNPLQGYSFCPLISCAGRSVDGGSSQDDPRFWDELPSSESLNEFIARIEDGNAMASPTETKAWGYFPSKKAGGIHGRVNQSSPRPDAASTSSQAHEKLREVAEQVGESKGPITPCHQSNQLSLNGKEYQQEASSSTSSNQGKDEWECLSNHHQILLPQLSPVGIKPSGLKGSCLSPKEGVDRDVAGPENHRASCSLKPASYCLKSPTHSNRKRDDNETGLRKEESSRSGPKPDKVCTGQPIPEVQENPSKGGDISDLLRDSPICPQGSYNASADLFDVSTAAGTEVGMFSMGQAFSAQGGTLTVKSTGCGGEPSELEASWTTSPSGSSLLDLFTASGPKASTPDAGPMPELECGPSGTQDFVPSSQFTPRVRRRQQARLPQGKESALSKLPLNELPWVNDKWKRPRPAFKGPLVKQLFSKFRQSRRSSDMSSATRDTSATRGLFISGSPAQELSENDSPEWIPPSEKKWRQPLPLHNKKKIGLRRSWDITEKTPFSEKQTRWEIPRGTIGLARTEFSPKNQRPTEVNEDEAEPEQVTVSSPGFCTFSDGGRLNLSSPPHSTPNTMTWSPELFEDNNQLLTTEVTL